MPRTDTGEGQGDAIRDGLADDIARSIRWTGSRDAMWRRIEARLARRSPWRASRVLPGAALLAMVAVAAVFALTVARHDEDHLVTKDAILLPHLSASLHRDKVEPGETVQVDVTVSAPGGASPAAPGEGTVLVAIQPIGLDPVVLCAPVAARVPIAAGESVTPLTFVAPTEPGWYAVQPEMVIEREGKEVRIVGEHAPLFVNYPKGEVREGVVAVEKAVTRLGSTLKVHLLSMTPCETSVSYTLLNVEPGAASAVRVLHTGPGETVLLRREEKVLPGMVTGTAVFGPIPAAARSVTFEVALVWAEGLDARPSSVILAMEIPLEPR